MADISNHDDIIDVRDIIARVEELHQQRAPRFVSGWNMPGYMPDSEPAEFDTADAAKRSIIESIKHAEESAGTEEESEALSAFAEEINLDSDEFSVMGPDGLVYWVAEDGYVGLDESEREELETIENLLEELKGAGGDEQWEGDWYPVTLIRGSYFEDYAQELAEDIGAINREAEWPNNCIDWEKAARELQFDYSTVDYDGVQYWFR